ncbi:MAG: hypothetical protein AAF965_03660 [Pseudomonadota bacterium]
MLFLPLMAFVAALAGLAFMLGVRTATTTETEVIDRIAQLYTQEAAKGAARTDCKAVPAQSSGLWLVVICERPGGQGIEYFIDRFGRIADRRQIN